MPLSLGWGGGEFPYRVAGTGGNYIFKDEREVPDSFMLVADYPSGHSDGQEPPPPGRHLRLQRHHRHGVARPV